MRDIVNMGDPLEVGVVAILVQVVAGAGAEVKVASHRIGTLEVEVDGEVEVEEAKAIWTIILWISLSQ